MSNFETTSSRQPEEQERRQLVVDIEGYPTGDQVILEVPADFDYEAAVNRWRQCGGQVRDFSGDTVDMKKLDFLPWMISQEGARFAQQ